MKKKKYISVSSGYRMFEKYENKINFQNLLDQLGIASPRHMVINAKKIDYNQIREKVGSEFVMQVPSTALGAGTFFVLKKSDFDDAIKKEVFRKAIKNNIDLRITEYIKKACSPSMTVCVSSFGVLRTGLQRQIIDAKEVLGGERMSGVYCGHDWYINKINPDVQKKAIEIAEKIGNYFKDQEKFRGIFGIDFVLEKKTNQLYPIEANVRLLGSFPVISMIQEDINQPVIQALQILEGLDKKDYELDIERLNKLMSEPKDGSHINIYSKSNDLVYVAGIVKPGIYKADVTKGKINYLREGTFFDDLKNKKEILLTGGVPKQGRVYEPHSNMCKIVSRGSFLNNDDKLNDFAKLMVSYVYNNLALEKVHK